MARKHLLADLAGSKLPAGNLAPEPPAGDAPGSQRQAVPGSLVGGGARGAIGAVTRSLEQFKAQSVVELKPELIDASPITDRLPGTAEGHAELMASIREHGQQVPILVRPHPTLEGRYQIAYGRRRLRALSELGSPVRSVVKPLTDDQMVIAQGMENSARADLSFIERSLFAASLEAGGFKRDTIMAALSVDKTGLSRLISSASRIPRHLIDAIGPAPKAGRDRWVELAVRLEAPGAAKSAEVLISAEAFPGKTSDERFAAVFDALARKRDRARRPEVVRSGDGRKLARWRKDGSGLTLVVEKQLADGFGAFLIARLPEMFSEFQDRSPS